MLLQPPGRYRHYGRACRIYYNTEPLYDPPLYYYYLPAFLVLPPYPRPLGLVDLLHLIE
jgi:hypothetical protein